MQTTQGYTFSGKQSSIDLLIKKSRGKARMMSCTLTQIGINGRTLNFADFFDKDGVRPNTISVGDWEIMSAVAYDCILQCCTDESCSKHFDGIDGGDGETLLARLQNVCGSKQQRIEQLDDDIKNCSVTTISKWPAYRDAMVTLLKRRNSVPNIAANEKESDAKQLRQFITPLAPLFSSLHENYIMDDMNAHPTFTIESVIEVANALWHAKTKGKIAARMNTMAVAQEAGEGASNGNMGGDMSTNLSTSNANFHGASIGKGKGKGGKGKGKGGKA